MGHHLHHHDGGDGVPQHVNSPRFSGPMTRRAQSFKRGGSGGSGSNNTGGGDNPGSLRVHHEIDVQLNSPRSEVASGPDLQTTVFDRKHQTYGQLRERVVKGLLRKPMDSVVSDFSFKERKKLGHWMFFAFCGVCLFMGVSKICATGWFGSAIDGAASEQDYHREKPCAPGNLDHSKTTRRRGSCATVERKTEHQNESSTAWLLSKYTCPTAAQAATTHPPQGTERLLSH